MGWRKQLRVLGLRDLRFVFGATLVSDLGDGIVAVAFVWAVLDLTRSATDLGIILACRIVAQILVVLIGGVIADRMSRRLLMIGADLTRLAVQALTGLLLISHHATVLELAASQVALGAASAFFQPAANGLLPAVAGDFKQEANAMRGIASAVSSIAGPALGAVFVVAVGGAWGLLADSLSYGLSALFLARVHAAAAATPTATGQSMLRDLRDGFGEVASRTWVWAVIVAFALSNSLAGTWPVFGPLAARRWYGGVAAYALLSIVWSVGTLLGGAALLRFKPRRPLRVGVLLCAPCVLPTVLLAVRVPLWIVVPLQLLAGIGPIALNTLWWTALQDNVPAGAISRVVSFDYAGSYLLMPLGTVLAGPLSAGIGLGAAMLAANLASFALMCSTLLVADVRNLSATVGETGIVSA